jgi:cytochrome c peroxidase
VHFYNTRDVLPNAKVVRQGKRSRAGRTPETPQKLNPTCCNLGLSGQQEDDLVAFLKTLTDGYAK